MNELFFQERRQHWRYEGALQVNLSSMHVPRKIVAGVHDIGPHGLGVTLNAAIKTGLWLDVDVARHGSNDRVKSRGRVVWVNRITDDHYRAGIELANGDSQPGSN